MKIDKLNPWLSFAGNIAILLGLIAVAIEIRDNSVAIRTQELGAIRELSQERYVTALSQEFASLYVKSLRNPADMTVEELWRITNYASLRLSHAQRAFQAYQNGILRKSEMEEEVVSIQTFLGTEFGRLLWKTLKADYGNTPDFVAAVDSAFAANTTVPDDRWLADLQIQSQTLKSSSEQQTSEPD